MAGNSMHTGAMEMGKIRSIIVRSLVAVTGAIVPVAARGQQVGWSGSAEANASLLFGNASNRLVAGRLQFGRADSTLDVRTDSRISYAETADEDGRRRVSGRTLLASLAADYHPFQRWSPFWFGAFESSLQQRIDQRYSTGAGAKYTIYRDKDTEASVSLAALAEHTVPRLEPAAPDTGSVWRARWSLRVRARHPITKTTRFTHVTFYQPRMDRVSRYTIRSTTMVAADLTSRTALTLTFTDLYDSESRERGARTNNDGQLLFGVNAAF